MNLFGMASSASKRKKSGSARRPAAGAGLTAERIRDEALRLIDAEGLESFSTRRLGAALGCEAMAIYWYYPSKDALLDAVVEALIARLPIEPSNAGDWIDALRKLAHAYRRLAHQHPHAFPLLATRRFATEGTWRFMESLFELARLRGLDERTTARFYRLVASYCSGVALNELATLREVARGGDSGELKPQHAADREKFPRLAAVAAWLEPAHFDDVFAFGLELLLDALARASVEAGRSERTRRRES
jgi:AcrR family transcriptional regulator